MRICTLAILAAGLAFSSASVAQCPPQSMTRGELFELKAQAFVVDDDAARNRLALDLLGCLADPDPKMRDGVVYEAIATWGRGELLLPDTLQALRGGLIAKLKGEDDPQQFRRAFAALVLSEVARVDRIKPVFSDTERQQLATVAADFIRGVEDYRGYDEQVGWRHQVAHASDVVLQLALNPQMPTESVMEMLDAMSVQIAPAAVGYTHSEPERFARAAFYAHQRGALNADWWQGWLSRVTAAAPAESWAAAQQTKAGITRRNNLFAFLFALHFAAANADNEAGNELMDQIVAAMQGMT